MKNLKNFDDVMNESIQLAAPGNALNFYDLNEIWACLHTAKKSFEDAGSENLVSGAEFEIAKMDRIMKALKSQKTNQSDYELRIVSRITGEAV